jgi:hypothetical protein
MTNEKARYQFDHFGVPVKEKQVGMIYFEEFKVWTSDYEKNPYRIEHLFFEENCTLHPLIQTKPHICFLVEDIYKATLNKVILLHPIFYQDYYMAFISDDGILIELLQINKK